MQYTTAALALMVLPFIAAQSLADIPTCAVSWQHRSLPHGDVEAALTLTLFSWMQHKQGWTQFPAVPPIMPVSAETQVSWRLFNPRLRQHAVHPTKRVSSSHSFPPSTSFRKCTKMASLQKPSHLRNISAPAPAPPSQFPAAAAQALLHRQLCPL